LDHFRKTDLLGMQLTSLMRMGCWRRSSDEEEEHKRGLSRACKTIAIALELLVLPSSPSPEPRRYCPRPFQVPREWVVLPFGTWPFPNRFRNLDSKTQLTISFQARILGPRLRPIRTYSTYEYLLGHGIHTSLQGKAPWRGHSQNNGPRTTRQ